MSRVPRSKYTVSRTAPSSSSTTRPSDGDDPYAYIEQRNISPTILSSERWPFVIFVRDIRAERSPPVSFFGGKNHARGGASDFTVFRYRLTATDVLVRPVVRNRYLYRRQFYVLVAILRTFSFLKRDGFSFFVSTPRRALFLFVQLYV